MPTVQKKLADPVLIGTSNTTLFANPSGQVSYVGGLILFNSHSSTVSVTVYDAVPPSGGSVGTPTLVYQAWDFSLASKRSRTWRIPPPNVYPEQDRAMIAVASVNNVVSATVVGSIEGAVASQLTYPRIADPLFLGSGTGSSTTVLLDNPAGVKTFVSGFYLHNTSSSSVTPELWHLVPPSGGGPGTPALAQQFWGNPLPGKATLDYHFPFLVGYEDAARSIRGRASTAGVVKIQLMGGRYV